MPIYRIYGSSDGDTPGKTLGYAGGDLSLVSAFAETLDGWHGVDLVGKPSHGRLEEIKVMRISLAVVAAAQKLRGRLADLHERRNNLDGEILSASREAANLVHDLRSDELVV